MPHTKTPGTGNKIKFVLLWIVSYIGVSLQLCSLMPSAATVATQGLKKRAWRHGRAWKMKIHALKNHDPCCEFASKLTQLYRHKV